MSGHKVIEALLSEAEEPEDFEAVLEVGMMVLKVADILANKNREENGSGTAIFHFEIDGVRYQGALSELPREKGDG